MTILRKIVGEPRGRLFPLSCGHETPLKLVGGNGWTDCSTCGLERHTRTTGKQGAAIARAAASGKLRERLTGRAARAAERKP